jgi:hypothetical protein
MLLLASTAGATNLGLSAGVLMPIGDFADQADPSPYIGAHWEIQDINARGQAALLTVIVQGGFAFLKTDADLERALDAIGDSGDGSYFDVGAGVRVHSAALPIFVTAGANYVNLNPAGSGGSLHGGGGTIGLGVERSTAQIKYGAELRASFAVLENDVTEQHLLLMGTLGLPF